VKQNRMGDVFLSIVESKPTETETFDRRSIVVFREDMRGFLKAFQSTLGFMEKPGAKTAEMSFSPDEEMPDSVRRKIAAASGRGEASARADGAGRGDLPGLAKDAAAKGGQAAPEKKRRVVVRKRPAAGEAPAD